MPLPEIRRGRIIVINPDPEVSKMYQQSLARAPGLKILGTMAVTSLVEGVRAIIMASEEGEPFNLAVIDTGVLGPPGEPNPDLLDLLRPPKIPYQPGLLITGALPEQPIFGEVPFFDFLSAPNGSRGFARAVSVVLEQKK